MILNPLCPLTDATELEFGLASIFGFRISDFTPSYLTNDFVKSSPFTSTTFFSNFDSAMSCWSLDS